MSIYKIANAPILATDITPTDCVASWRTGNIAPSYVQAEDGEWNFEKRPGMMYVAVRAVSVGTNGNGDHFTEDELRKSYKTFIGKGVFVNHASNDVEKKRGMIVDARWVEAGPAEKYVVCLLEMNETAFGPFCQMIRTGQITSVSMGAVYDIGLPHFVTLENNTVKSYFDIEVGDRVITHDGSISEVVARGKEWHENHDAYVIKAMKAEPLVLSSDHPMLVLRKEDKKTAGAATFVEAKDIRKGDYLLSSIYSKVINTDFSIDTAALIGWYLAEGSLCDKTGISLVLSTTDPIEDIEQLIKRVDETATIHKYPHPSSSNAINLRFYSAKVRSIIENNVMGNAKSKSMSQTLLDMEPEKQLALIGAYIDGDGCLASNKSTPHCAVSIATASSALAHQIPMMLERSNILASVHSIDRKPGHNSVVSKPFTQHTLFIGSSYLAPLRKFSRKVLNANAPKVECKRSFVYEGYVAVPVTSVEAQKYSGWAYNIQVSGDENSTFIGNHSYHLNGLASHNCQVAFSQCSVCSHVAKTTDNYCMHVENHKGGAYNGKPVFEINRGIEFIELSWVTVGADPQAKLLEVIARQRGLDFQELLCQAAKGNQIVESMQNQGMEHTIFEGIRRARLKQEEDKK